uniref:LRAT domain-containing protein n=1 Tax=Picea sitchensis TaxID=3332 RepID=B8LR67_PICSI|nr:unknown [Picea sitchensis]
MGLFSNEVDRKLLKAGDHVYTWRAAYSYTHYGIYVGGNYVIHFTAGPSESSFSSSLPTTMICPNYPDSCGSHHRKAGVIRSCLDCFLDGRNVYLFQYNVARFVFMAHARGGTCTLEKSDPTNTVLRRAEYLLEKGFGDYSILSNNCEGFAIYCKTGFIGNSGQATGVMSGVKSASISALTLAVQSPLMLSQPLGLAYMLGCYCYGRYKADVGARVDKMKVPLESLREYLPAESSTSQRTIPAAASSTSQPLIRAAASSISQPVSRAAESSTSQRTIPAAESSLSQPLIRAAASSTSQRTIPAARSSTSQATMAWSNFRIFLFIVLFPIWVALSVATGTVAWHFVSKIMKTSEEQCTFARRENLKTLP